MYRQRRQLCAILLIMTIAASLTACGGNVTREPKEANSPGASSQQSQQSTDEVGPSAEIEEAEQEPEIIQETIEDRAKKAAETLKTWDGSIAESFDGGDGSAENPYQISNGEQLAKLASDTNSGVDFSGAHFVLTSDILLNDISSWNFELSPKENASGGFMVNQWAPIGLIHRFNGSFDGGNHIIFGLWNTGFYSRSGSSSPVGNVGLFGEFSGNLSNINIACGWLSPGCENIGTIAGSVYEGYIYNCDVYQVGIEPIRATNIGGICGEFANNDGIRITNSSSDSYIAYANVEGKSVYAGGIVGYGAGYWEGAVISNCYSQTDLSITSDVIVTDTSNYNLPQIYAGGICGVGDIIDSCYCTSNIAVNATMREYVNQNATPLVMIGGIAGVCFASISNCGNCGCLSYLGDIAETHMGGIAGRLGISDSKVEVSFCYADTTIKNGITSENNGGIVGCVTGETTIKNCYYNMEHSNSAIAHTYFSGVFTDQTKGLSSEELHLSANYYNWDFNSIWIIDDDLNDGLPMLRSLVS